MAERSKGKTLYEVCIVVLVIALIFTILYPSKVWKNEVELEAICRARMDAFNLIEYQYLSFNMAFNDSVAEVMDRVLSDANALMALDSTIMWDQLVGGKDLKKLVFTKQFPEDLRTFIFERINSGQPVGNLMKWDNLGDKLIALLKEVVMEDSVDLSIFDQEISWPTLLGEDTFLNILGNEEIPDGIRRNVLRSVQRGTPVIETRYWNTYRPYFYNGLEDVIFSAERTDIWGDEMEEKWEIATRARWNSSMDTLTQADRDSIWLTYQRQFWEDEKELIWKKIRKKLWKQGKDKFAEENAEVWKRTAGAKWASERKKEWENEQVASLPDSLLSNFPAEKDSLWRTVVDSIQALEYDRWESANDEYIEELIRSLWDRITRAEWEDGAYQNWLVENEKNRNKLWSMVKESLWKLERPDYWKMEQEKIVQKYGARKRIDDAVRWMNILGQERIEAIVNNLDLPGSRGVWKAINKSKKKDVSPLYELGIAGLFKDDLLLDVTRCPLAHQHYLVSIDNSEMIKKIAIACPIKDNDRVKSALVIDPVTNDSSYVDLKINVFRKLFGGGSIKNHGEIDMDGKKSWMKRGK